ncbi:MAG: FmdB family zinc ribbon protein [Bryobacteraceae bacterium]
MPIYEYHCGTCDTKFEKIQKFADAPLTIHEECGGPVERLISSPAFHFKGTGWYVTDYAKTNGKAPNGKDGSESKEDKSGEKAEKKEAADKADRKEGKEPKSDSSESKKTETAKTDSSATPASTPAPASTVSSSSDKK